MATPTRVFVCTSTNYWRNKSGYKTVVGVSDSFESGVALFTKQHECGQFCDWCNPHYKWKKSRAMWERLVDHDGASVVYVIKPENVFRELVVPVTPSSPAVKGNRPGT